MKNTVLTIAIILSVQVSVFNHEPGKKVNTNLSEELKEYLENQIKFFTYRQTECGPKELSVLNPKELRETIKFCKINPI